jgi:retinol dehydrogenase-14
MDQKTCLITGATSGIGKAAALAMAKKNYRLVLVGRNEEKTARVCGEIERETHNERIGSYVCDLSVLQDVRELAGRITKDHQRIDILINNAGARFLRHQLTKERLELTLATNHLGHFVLALSLIDALKSSGSARIVNVSSGAHSAGTSVIENILSAREYDGRKQYSNSKLANVLFTYALAEKLKGSGIVVNAVDPGGVATNFALNNGLGAWLTHRLYYLRKRQLLTPMQGAETVVYLASSDAVMGITGRYFFNKKETRSSDISYDKAAQERLWEMSVELSGNDL